MPHITTKIPCPVCGQPMNHFSWGYSCSGYRSGDCKFGFGYTIAGRKFTDEEIHYYLQQLTAKGETEVIQGFLSKKGNPFSASFKLNGDKMDFVFPPRGKPTNLTCPQCGKPLRLMDKGYSCSGYPECKFALWDFCGHRFTEEEATKLFRGEEVYIPDLISKKGNTFNAYIRFQAGEPKPLSLRFPDLNTIY